MFAYMDSSAHSGSPVATRYVDRLRALLSNRAPLEVLRTTVVEIHGLVRGLGNAQLTKQPLPGKWSVSEIIAHLCDSETATRFRLRQILTQPNGNAIPAYDQDGWADVSGNSKVPVEESLELFFVLRRSNLRLWESLTSAQLAKYGEHEERGRESVEDLLVLIAGHDINHLNQIRSIVSSSP